MSWSGFLWAYLLGGVTFLPLLVIVVFAHAYVTLPVRRDAVGPSTSGADDDLVQPGDDIKLLKAAQQDGTKARTVRKEQDVAAGYFAVCREYTPMGINAKPIERATPVGSATVAAPSPSVYQTMYRSIFDRKPTPGPLDNKNNSGSQRPKKAGNVFYVVLRHGHLMLFDDDEQLEVRHVISLSHHNISIYSGEPVTPEGELYIKRNAICLSRRASEPPLSPDGQLSKPFYLFSENCSAKEDFYFAMLRNQEQAVATEGPEVPTPIQFDVKNMISLVQKLHSSEEHMQTRWLNAMIGRVFLGVHKTKDVENFIREKLTKKISRVKRPAFLSNITIKNIDTGDSAPYITNPRLKDLTVEGECGIEADVRYTGNFRLEVAATARIDLGTRFKAREVNLVLAVVMRKLEGHVLFKIKAPPSNRVWFSFQQMPKIEMTIEPIVSSRQITYTVILRQIENRIKEVIAETLVLPFWDDTPFFDTEHKKWRGGIFHDDTVKVPTSPEAAAAQEGDLGEVDRLEDNQGIQESDIPSIEKSYSLPVLDKRPSIGLFGKKLSSKTSKTDLASSPSVSSTSVETKSETKGEMGSPPPVLSAPFAQPSSPTIGTIATNADQFRPSSSPPNGDSAMSAMASLSTTPPASAVFPAPSPTHSTTQASNPNAFKPYTTSKSTNLSSASVNKDSTDLGKDTDKTPQARRNTVSSTESQSDNGSQSPTPSLKGSVRGPGRPTSRSFFSRRDTASSVSSGVGSQTTAETQKRTTLNTIANAAGSAKRWGFNAFQRRNNDENGPQNGKAGDGTSGLDLSQPMGRGQPLPPPGTPLPMPEKTGSTGAIQMPKRKPIPLSTAERQPDQARQGSERPSVQPPPLPKRRQHRTEEEGEENGMLVVTAPAESEPTTPLSATHSVPDALPAAEATDESATQPSIPDDTQHTTKSTKSAESTESTQSSLPSPEEAAVQDKAVGAIADPGPTPDEDYSAWMEEEETDESDPSADTKAA
ncbi:uncharacterized protein C8A04DRAFT_33193 [Dichotomopilus funicola]|uniref:SMP-LTD domain-containing protein n=1 Tax=Dichotomopilus funicola TaxID=1934379 RepID=A0AAN6UUS5_9PEZI|nr:hypothetical protein C8A04DRAFT_33193 [Dichotomopilus funicola]